MSFSKSRLYSYDIKYSQNFIKSNTLAKKVIDLTCLKNSDYIIEIGPGKGKLTKFILKKTQNLTLVEKDFNLSNNLKSKLKNIEVINQDFLKFNLPQNNSYKVIGNIPFGITSEILKKILDLNNPPEEIYLILQKEAAFRFLGQGDYSNSENLFSLKYKPFFTSQILLKISRNNFSPVPSVDAVLLQIKKRKNYLISEAASDSYINFLTYSFLNWNKNYKKLFTYKQITLVKKLYKIDLKQNPSNIKFEEWLILFEIYTKYVPEFKKKFITTKLVNLHE